MPGTLARVEPQLRSELPGHQVKPTRPGFVEVPRRKITRKSVPSGNRLRGRLRWSPTPGAGPCAAGGGSTVARRRRHQGAHRVRHHPRSGTPDGPARGCELVADQPLVRPPPRRPAGTGDPPTRLGRRRVARRPRLVAGGRPTPPLGGHDWPLSDRSPPYIWATRTTRSSEPSTSLTVISRTRPRPTRGSRGPSGACWRGAPSGVA